VRLLIAILIVGTAQGVLAPTGSAQRFLPDDPIRQDPDNLDMPVPVARPASDYARFLSNAFSDGRDRTDPAVNVNTLEEVPNSSWYRNRHFETALTLDELREGAGDSIRIDTTAALTVENVTSLRPVPSAVVQDASGQRFRLRLDVPNHPVLSTAAGVVANRAYHALGYNVPSMHVTYLRASDLQAPEDGSVTASQIADLLENAAPLSNPPRVKPTAGGKTRRGPSASRPMVTLPRATPGAPGLPGPREPTPIYRAVAIRIPETVVKRIGPFRFTGTRPDDGNDIFPHQDRRELRGLHVAASWLHHTGIRATRTLDVAVREGDKTFVRHYIYDTFESLGSGLSGPKEPWMGREYLVEINPVLLRMGTLGLSGGDWVNIEVPDVEHVGRFAARGFRPRTWQPEHPNPAFARRDSADTFWMARKVAHISDREIRAMVNAAQYPRRESADYVATVLEARRDSIAAAYLGFGGGLDRFRVSGSTLAFEDLLRRHVPAPPPQRRFATWHRFSNDQNHVTDALGQTPVNGTRVPIPDGHAPYLRVRISTPGFGHTDVYLRRTAAASTKAVYTVVGIDRAANRDE
jgi:hypothetical protein